MDGSGSSEAYRSISVVPCSPHVGAEIFNIDLTRPLTDLEISELRRAFTEHLVVFFRDQKISFEDHVRLGEYFGRIGAHVGKSTISKTTDDPRVRKFHYDSHTPKVSGDRWHTDQPCAAVPPLGSILYNHTLPPNGGGDTVFASMYAAYDALSERMKTYLDGLTALHDGVRIFGPGTPRTSHPVIARHPESGVRTAKPCSCAAAGSSTTSVGSGRRKASASTTTASGIASCSPTKTVRPACSSTACSWVDHRKRLGRWLRSMRQTRRLCAPGGPLAQPRSPFWSYPYILP